jgi:hypothetical protein
MFHNPNPVLLTDVMRAFSMPFAASFLGKSALVRLFNTKKRIITFFSKQDLTDETNFLK